jgi:hypothetical protein
LSAAGAPTDGFVPTGRPADTISVSLLTFQPGSEYWQRFGHDALLLRESTSGEAITYNYGLFDFRQKNFFLNFARGYMIYRVAPNWLANDLPIYAQDGRWALEQKLDLTSEQRSWLRDYLEWITAPEHAEYRYDYFLSNCSTRVRDALDRALGGALRKQLEGRATPATYRSEALRLISPDLPMFIGMDAALGPTADKPIDLWQQSFGPITLMEAVRTVRVKGEDGREHPLVASETRLLEGSTALDPPAAAPSLNRPFLLAGLGLTALLVLLATQRRRLAARILTSLLATAMSLTLGVAGLILALLWAFTDHWAGWHNENLLLMNPASLLLLPACVLSLRAQWNPGKVTRSLATVLAVSAVAAALLRLAPGAYQGNLHWLLLILPIQLGLALFIFRVTQQPREP